MTKELIEVGITEKELTDVIETKYSINEKNENEYHFCNGVKILVSEKKLWESERQSHIEDQRWLFNMTCYDQIREINKYDLKDIPVFKRQLSVCNKVLELEKNHDKKSLVGIKRSFVEINTIDNDIKEDVIKYFFESCKKDDRIKEFITILTDIVLVNDLGLQKTDENGITYQFFMEIENCRKYIQDMGFIQLYSHTGLYNTITKTKYDYKKSKDFLKRFKILKLRKLKDNKGDFSFVSLDKLFFMDEHNKNFKLIWNPNKDKLYTENEVNYFNEYDPIQYQGIDHGKDLSLIYYHIKHFLCSDREDVYTYFISVISDMIHNPGRKLPVSIIMNGDGGVGKSFLFDKLFRKMFGDMFGSMCNKFPSRFNSILENKICFLIEEFTHQDNVNESNLFKDYISNPFISIERKGMEPHYTVNCIRFFVCSNGEWSSRIENNNSSRRFLVCDVSDSLPDTKHFEDLSVLIKGDKRRGVEDEEVLKETIEQFIFDMGKIDTSVLETDPPETESKKVSQSYSKGIQEKQLEGFFEKVLNQNGHYSSINNNYETIKIIDQDDEFEINSFIFWDCFTDYLKDMRQQIPNGYSNYGRILSKWFGKDFSKINTKNIDGKRNRMYTFPKMEVVEDIILGK